MCFAPAPDAAVVLLLGGKLTSSDDVMPGLQAVDVRNNTMKSSERMSG